MNRSAAVRRATLLALAFFFVAPPAHAADPKPGALPPGLEMLRRTERAFAAATAEIGIRNGFLTFFDADCIAPPRAGSAPARMVNWPNPVEPEPHDLRWEPLTGDISNSMDMGWLTGPSSFTDSEGKPHPGIYFSIWRKNAAGLWRVSLDAGIDLPSAAPEFASGKFHAAAGPAWKGAKPDSVQAFGELQQAERDFETLLKTDASAAYEKYLAANARAHRQGRLPLLGRDAVLAAEKSAATAISTELLHTEMASAGDMGWTFGSIEWTKDGKTLKGGASRVWKRDVQGNWKIAVDVLNPPRQ